MILFQRRHGPCRPATTSRVAYTVSTSTPRYRSTETVAHTSHDTRAMCMRTRSMAPHSHTRHALTHGQWLSHTSCSSVLFISIHRDATSLRLSASSERKSATSQMLRCCLRWTDRSAAALRTCLPFSAPAESCERVPATVVFPAFRRTQIITYAPRRSTPRCRFPTYWSDHRARLSSHATCTSLPPPQPSGRRLHAAACSPPPPPARRLHAACAAFGRAPLTRA